MNIHLVTFATPTKYGQENYYKESIDRLVESGKLHGIDHAHIYTPETLPVNRHLLQYMQDTFDPGFGFYSWKPTIILDVFDKINDGDVVVYHDAGRKEYKYEFKKDIRILVNEVIQECSGVGVGNSEWNHKDWCKRDCFVYMGCNEQKYWELKQLTGNWSIWQKNSLSKQILEEWKMYCFDPRGIITTHTTEGPLSDFDTFKEHRWDQAILTNLIYKYHFNKTGIRILKQNTGWEKDINNFINEEPVNNKLEYSLLKRAHIINTNDGVTIVIDVVYKNNNFYVITTGAVKSVILYNLDMYMEPSETILDPHDNVNLYKFHAEYSRLVEFKFEYHDAGIYNETIMFNIERDYYNDYLDENIISAISNTSFNSIENIKTFCKYHINLGYDRIILHDVGPKIFELYDALREYIESDKIILIEWGIKQFYQQFRKINQHRTNVGDTSQMNHSLHIFKNSKYLTILNTDEYIVPKKDVKNITLYFDELIKKYNATSAGGLDIKVLDFKKPDQDVPFYKSNEVLVSRAGKHGVDNKNLILPNNVNTITCHSITSGNPIVHIDIKDLAINHYHFLYGNNTETTVIYTINNINVSLFE